MSGANCALTTPHLLHHQATMNHSRGFQATRNPPPTAGEKDIETARRRTWANYHSTSADQQFSNWYLEKVQDQHVAERLQDLYTDRNNTNKQNQAIFVANMYRPSPGALYSHEKYLETLQSPISETYVRVLTLYDERMAYIKEVAVERISLWSEWYKECQRHDEVRNDAFIAACESTIKFMEDDYRGRLVDFATEVYALLVEHDGVCAKMVLEDLVAVLPVGERVAVVRLEDWVVGYEGVARPSATMERVRD
jgi:hypothetical protein